MKAKVKQLLDSNGFQLEVGQTVAFNYFGTIKLGKITYLPNLAKMPLPSIYTSSPDYDNVNESFGLGGYYSDKNRRCSGSYKGTLIKLEDIAESGTYEIVVQDVPPIELNVLGKTPVTKAQIKVEEAHTMVIVDQDKLFAQCL